MERFIPLSVPNLKGRELEYVTHAIETEWPYITEFEESLAKYVGVDEVIVPTLTFIAAVNPVKYIGAEAIFMDCDDSLTMDMVKLKEFCENECYCENNTLINKHTQKNIKAVHDEIGYNYRMPNIQAALGLAQLEQLETFIQIKKDNYEEYYNKDLKLMKFNDDIRADYWFYSYLTNSRDQLLNYLNEHNIQTRPIWKLIHTLKPYEGAQNYKIEKTFYYYDHMLNLPCSSNLSKEDVGIVASSIYEFNQMNKNRKD